MVAPVNFQQKKKNETKHFWDFEVKSEALRAYEVVASAVHTAKIGTKMSLTRAWDRATSACRCRRVSVGVQRYSVQCRGYNLIGVTTVEEDTARGRQH